MGRRLIDLTGQVFGMWRVLRRAPNSDGGLVRWLAYCDPTLGGCGKTVAVHRHALRSGKSTSCGCGPSAVKKHGMYKAPEYKAWESMIQRATNIKIKHSHRYSIRGIGVCQGFRDFVLFLSVMGNKPTTNHSLDRKDNDLGYSCGKCDECVRMSWKMNCRWATKDEQSRNTSRTRILSHNWKSMCVTDWAKELGMPSQTLFQRLKTMTVQEALTRPVRKRLRG